MLIGPEKLKCSFLSDEEGEIVYRDAELGRSYTDYCPTCRKRGTYGTRASARLRLPGTAAAPQALPGRWYWSALSAPDWDHYTGDPEVVKTLQAYVRRHDDSVDQGLGLLFTGTRASARPCWPRWCSRSCPGRIRVLLRDVLLGHGDVHRWVA